MIILHTHYIAIYLLHNYETIEIIYLQLQYFCISIQYMSDLNSTRNVIRYLRILNVRFFVIKHIQMMDATDDFEYYKIY
jgi:hypothetical protein